MEVSSQQSAAQARARTSSPVHLRPRFSRSPHSSPSIIGLPRLDTHVTPRSTPSQHRQSTHSNKRISTLSTLSQQVGSRPESRVFPAFHSSLEYALVRDFAYPIENSMHYGPPPEGYSAVTTPASEVSRRMSDPLIQRSFARVEEEEDDGSYFQLPKSTFGDSPEDARYFAFPSGHRRGRSNLADYDSSRGMAYGDDGREKQEANRILYPDADSQYYHSPSARTGQHSPARSAPYSHSTASPSRSPSDAYDDEDYALNSPEGPFRGKAVALYNFEQENDNELAFREGQVLQIQFRQDEGWLVAVDPTTGASGLVPEEYVRMVRDIEGGLIGLRGRENEEESPDAGDDDTSGEVEDTADGSETTGSTDNTRSVPEGLQTKSTDANEEATPIAISKASTGR